METTIVILLLILICSTDVGLILIGGLIGLALRALFLGLLLCLVLGVLGGLAITLAQYTELSGGEIALVVLAVPVVLYFAAQEPLPSQPVSTEAKRAARKEARKTIKLQQWHRRSISSYSDFAAGCVRPPKKLAKKARRLG